MTQIQQDLKIMQTKLCRRHIFLKKIDRLLDCLNSKCPYDKTKIKQSALDNDVYKYLSEMLDYIGKIKTLITVYC